MKVLGLDTSTSLASVALVENGELIAECTQTPSEKPRGGSPVGAANNSATLLGLIGSMLQERQIAFNDVDVIGISIGPGSFTGLRVGLSIAKGLVYGSRIPLFGVRTLEALARCAPYTEDGLVCPLMDARKGQVYAALYRRVANRLACVMGDTLDTPDKILERVASLGAAKCIFLGEAVRVYEDLITRTLGPEAKLVSVGASPSTASAVARIAEEKSLESDPEPLQSLAPDYLRPPDAVPPKPRV